MSKLARPITKDEVAAFHNAGVLLLRGILNLSAINTLRRSLDEVANNQASRGSEAWETRSNAKGELYQDTAVSSRLKEFRRFAVNGPVPEIAAALLDSEAVKFYGDEVLISEPRSDTRAPFHQDASHFEIDGNQCCVFWIPVDPSTLQSGTMMYVRSSHRDGKVYRPNLSHPEVLPADHQYDLLPDVEGRLSDFDIVHFDVEPGDVIVHHYRTIHGTAGNASRYQVCRAALLRYIGDDIRFRTRPWTCLSSGHPQRLQNGDLLDGPDFPVVWRRRTEQEAA